MGERRAEILLTVVAVAATAAIGLFVLASIGASLKQNRAEQYWIAALGRPEEVFAELAPRETNAFALELERLAARAGIDVEPRWRSMQYVAGIQRTGTGVEFDVEPRWDGPHEQRVAKSDPAALQVIARATPYMHAQVQKNTRGVDTPPDFAQEFLDHHAHDLEALRAHLEGGTVPYWKADWERGHAAPLPNLIGHLRLQKVLVLDALARLHTGDSATALRDLESSWTLLQAVWEDPDMIEQLIVDTEMRWILAVLRQVPHAPAGWRERLHEHDFRLAFLRAAKFGPWIWTQPEVRPIDIESASTLGMLAQDVVRPYFAYCVADAAEDMRTRIAALERLPALCDYDLERRRAALAIDLSRWNMAAGWILTDLSQAVDRLARLELDVELTERVLDLDAGVGAGSTNSRACPRDRWTYEHLESEGVRIGLGREVRWTGLPKPDLPAAFTVAAPLH